MKSVLNNLLGKEEGEEEQEKEPRVYTFTNFNTILIFNASGGAVLDGDNGNTPEDTPCKGKRGEKVCCDSDATVRADSLAGCHKIGSRERDTTPH
mmetsp:Transcript_16602/g.22002  ORF Transcript_16602/g.22002 Transcript_16602/m.22002 type:complete len:95 (+) Transcript_16602:710-994(+)